MFKKAERKQSKLRLAITGASGSGKTTERMTASVERIEWLLDDESVDLNSPDLAAAIKAKADDEILILRKKVQAKLDVIDEVEQA